MAFIDFADLFAKALPIPRPKPTQARTLSHKEKKKIAKWNLSKSGRLVRKAAEIMKDKGYTTGTLHDTDGYCIRGAVNYAWCGNPRITSNGDYELFTYTIGQPIPQRRNPEVIQALIDFRDFLAKNDFAQQPGCAASVESFNDTIRDKDEVIRWMHKFADEVDPQR